MEPHLKAAVFYENGPPSVLRYEDVSEPMCTDDGVLIRVEAIPIEGGDTLSRLLGPLRQSPQILGYQAAGEVLEVGRNAKGFRVGDKVCTFDYAGSHAELRAAPAATCWKIPELGDVQAASVVPVTFGTAHDCLFEFGRIQPGDTVLVQAGASGVGIAAIQLAQLGGATSIIATASSNARLEKLTALGLSHGVNYREENVVERVMQLTAGRGADIVVDTLGGPALEASILCLAPRGRLVVAGRASRDASPNDALERLGPNRSITRLYFGAEIASPRVRLLMSGLLGDMASGRIRAVIDRTYPLSRAAEAHRYIESRQAVGRVLLIP